MCNLMTWYDVIGVMSTYFNDIVYVQVNDTVASYVLYFADDLKMFHVTHACMML